MVELLVGIMTPILYVRIPILFRTPLERLILSSSTPIRGTQSLRRTCYSVCLWTSANHPTLQDDVVTHV